MSAHSISERARRLHSSAMVIDTHADTTQRFLDRLFDIGIRHPDGNLDVPRMREGGVGAIFFAIWSSSRTVGATAVRKARQQIAAIREQARLNAKDLALATTAFEIRQAHAKNKIAVLMGLEGGHMIGNDLAHLREFAREGVRYMTLTHMGNTEWADSSTDQVVQNGLSDFGKDVIGEMNRLGMIVDVSHASDKTFYDVLAVSKAPIFASHSCCRAICNSVRNLSDQMIRDLARKSGLIQINFHVGFLSQEYRDFEKQHPGIDKEITAEVKARCGDNQSLAFIAGDQVVRDFMQAGKLPEVDFTAILEHIDHAVQLVGPDYVGLGSDFDGAVMPIGMEEATQLPRITEGLLQKGYQESDIRKILGENTLRLMTDVERIGRELNSISAKVI